MNHVALPVLTLSLCGNAALSEQMETLKKDFKESFMLVIFNIILKSLEKSPKVVLKSHWITFVSFPRKLKVS